MTFLKSDIPTSDALAEKIAGRLFLMFGHNYDEAKVIWSKTTKEEYKVKVEVTRSQVAELN